MATAFAAAQAQALQAAASSSVANRTGSTPHTPSPPIKLPSPRSTDPQAYQHLPFRDLDALTDTEYQRPTAAQCDVYFGNGFSSRFDVCINAPVPPQHESAYVQWLRAGRVSQILCWGHDRLRTSVCELRNVGVDGDQLTVAEGGEPIVCWRVFVCVFFSAHHHCLFHFKNAQVDHEPT